MLEICSGYTAQMYRETQALFFYGTLENIYGWRREISFKNKKVNISNIFILSFFCFYFYTAARLVFPPSLFVFISIDI